MRFLNRSCSNGRPGNIRKFGRVIVPPFRGNDANIVTPVFRHFAGFSECSLGCFAAMYEFSVSTHSFGLPEFSVTNLCAVRGLAPISTLNNTEKGKSALASNLQVASSIQHGRTQYAGPPPISSNSRRFAMHSLGTGTLSHVRIIEHYLRVNVRYLPRSGFFVVQGRAIESPRFMAVL